MAHTHGLHRDRKRERDEAWLFRMNLPVARTSCSIGAPRGRPRQLSRDQSKAKVAVLSGLAVSIFFFVRLQPSDSRGVHFVATFCSRPVGE